MLFDVKYLPADDQDRSKHVVFLMCCVQKYNFSISAFFGFIIWKVSIVIDFVLHTMCIRHLN